MFIALARYFESLLQRFDSVLDLETRVFNMEWSDQLGQLLRQIS